MFIVDIVCFFTSFFLDESFPNIRNPVRGQPDSNVPRP